MIAWKRRWGGGSKGREKVGISGVDFAFVVVKIGPDLGSFHAWGGAAFVSGGDKGKTW